MRKRDIHGKIKFTDLRSEDYDPAEHGDVDFEAGMRRLSAILPNNTVITGVEVFRQVYKAIGLAWIFSLTKLPVLGDFADSVYDLWAENRLRLTGHTELANVLRKRSEALKEANIEECLEDSCDLDFDGL